MESEGFMNALSTQVAKMKEKKIKKVSKISKLTRTNSSSESVLDAKAEQTTATTEGPEGTAESMEGVEGMYLWTCMHTYIIYTHLRMHVAGPELQYLTGLSTESIFPRHIL